jgi:hypothetical protein
MTALRAKRKETCLRAFGRQALLFSSLPFADKPFKLVYNIFFEKNRKITFFNDASHGVKIIKESKITV